MWQIIDDRGRAVAEVSDDGRHITGASPAAVSYISDIVTEYGGYSKAKVENIMLNHLTRISSLSAQKVAGGYTSAKAPRRKKT